MRVCMHTHQCAGLTPDSALRDGSWWCLRDQTWVAYMEGWCPSFYLSGTSFKFLGGKVSSQALLG